MKKLIICCLMIGLFGSVYGQKKRPVQRIDDLLKEMGLDSVEIDYDRVERRIEGSIEGYFDVTCEFTILPSPLEVATAELTFTATAFADRLLQDWVIEFAASDIVVDWLSSKQLNWPGPKSRGDILSTHIEFIPLESRQSQFTIALKTRAAIKYMPVQWCLDKDGRLLSLGNPYQGGLRSDPFRSTFFNDDSLAARYGSVGDPTRLLFKGRMVVTPPFHIGDTSTVRCYLTATNDLPRGFDMMLNSAHMRIVTPPSPYEQSITKGETIEISFEAKPDVVANPQWFDVSFYCESDRPLYYTKDQHMECTSVYNDDGSLRYFSRGLLRTTDYEQLSEAFPLVEHSGYRKSHRVVRANRQTIIGRERGKMDQDRR